MASYTVNKAAVARCRELIGAKQYVLDSDWGDVQPDAAAGTAYLERHSWDEYAAWHLGLTEGANDETKARYAFVYGDLPPGPPHRPDRLRLPGLRVAAQGGRARRPRPAPGARQGRRDRLTGDCVRGGAARQPGRPCDLPGSYCGWVRSRRARPRPVRRER